LVCPTRILLQLWFTVPPVPLQVNTLHLHANQQHLASSASDGAVAIWDVRNLATAAAGSSSSSSGRKQQQGKAARPLCALGHNKSSQGAVWCPDGRWERRLLLLQL
jgi:WD40 repeat protein